MSIQKAKEQLKQLLSNLDESVIALSGKWGTGKTHLWDEIAQESTDTKVKDCLYVSLFGVSTIDQLKQKLMESLIPEALGKSERLNLVKDILSKGLKAASEHYKWVGLLQEVNLIRMAPVVFNDRLIVIDDIERKHRDLGIDELLGFIDEYSKQYKTRFLLILNESQLSSQENQKELWDVFREKVIDREIKLTTTVEEAFLIAIGLVPSAYGDLIKKASSVCGITNIRILCKIIKVVNLILGERNLALSVQERTVPSIVLFSAIHYHGLSDGPSFEYVLDLGNTYWLDDVGDYEKSASQKNDREKRWGILINDLGIYGCDDFEKNLVDFLDSGLFCVDSINKILDRYREESEDMYATNDAASIVQRIFWDHCTDDKKLLEEVSSYINRVHRLDADTATRLSNAVKTHLNAQELAEEIIDKWIDDFELNKKENWMQDKTWGVGLHPKIQAVFRSADEELDKQSTLLDTCLQIYESEDWISRQQTTLKSATTKDFENVIRTTCDVDSFRKFMLLMTQMRAGQKFSGHFGSAFENFVNACRVIVTDPSSPPRLTKLIVNVFKAESLLDDLGSGG